jgi:hypothetical protein
MAVEGECGVVRVMRPAYIQDLGFRVRNGLRNGIIMMATDFPPCTLTEHCFPLVFASFLYL